MQPPGANIHVSDTSFNNFIVDSTLVRSNSFNSYCITNNVFVNNTCITYNTLMTFNNVFICSTYITIRVR